MDISVIIPWLISLAMLIVNLIMLTRNGKKDIREDEAKIDAIRESILKANMKLDQVCATTNETRSDIKSMQNNINKLNTELEVVKRDLHTAFVRIDELRDRMGG